MPGIEPLAKQDVPFRKVRNAINALVDRVNRQRPMTDNFDFFPNGFRIKGSSAAPTSYLPPFSPILSIADAANSSLTITPGYFSFPIADNSSGEVPTYEYWPYMPTIVSTPLDDPDTTPTLNLEHDETNYIECAVTLSVRETELGASEATSNQGAGSASGVVGISPTFPAFLDSVPGSVSGVQLTMPMINKSYEVTVAPIFSVNQTGFTKSQLETRYFPWGKYTLDSDGVPTLSEWYWTGHRQAYFETYVCGNNATGFNNVSGLNLGGDDTGANPKISWTP